MKSTIKSKFEDETLLAAEISQCKARAQGTYTNKEIREFILGLKPVPANEESLIFRLCQYGPVRVLSEGTEFIILRKSDFNQLTNHQAN